MLPYDPFGVPPILNRARNPSELYSNKEIPLEVVGLLVLREWRPLKEAPKPRPGKVPKRVLRKVPAPNGVLRKVQKSFLRVRASVENSTGEGTPKRFFGQRSAKHSFQLRHFLNCRHSGNVSRAPKRESTEKWNLTRNGAQTPQCLGSP